MLLIEQIWVLFDPQYFLNRLAPGFHFLGLDKALVKQPSREY